MSDSQLVYAQTQRPSHGSHSVALLRALHAPLPFHPLCQEMHSTRSLVGQMVQVGERMETRKKMQTPFSEEMLPTRPAWVRDTLEVLVVLVGHLDQLEAMEVEDHDSALLTVLAEVTRPWIPGNV